MLMARHASSITTVSNPCLRASSAEKRTQKSVAKPQQTTRSIPLSRRYPVKPVGVVLSFSKIAKKLINRQQVTLNLIKIAHEMIRDG